MRAVTICEPGGPEVLSLAEVPTPEPGSQQIRVRVHAAGVNRADLLQRRGLYPAPPGWPADIPGLEYAGAVDAVGPGATGWRVGDRAMGLVGGGGYAEYVIVHEREALPVPDVLTLEQAAATPEAFITAHDALFTRGQLAVGEEVLVHAVAGGVGTAALQLAKAAGATVIGTSRSKAKLDRAAQLGLDVAIQPRDGSFAEEVLAATKGRGVDLVLELVGGAYLAEDLGAVREQGRIVLVGLMAGATAELDLSALLRRRLTVVGTVLRSRPLEQKIAAAQVAGAQILPLLESGQVRPLVDRALPCSEAGEAHRLMEANEPFGKLVLAWD